MGKIYDVSTPIENPKTNKTFWLRIGTAWGKEKGLSVKLDALPVNGSIFISEREEKKEAEEGPEDKPKEEMVI